MGRVVRFAGARCVHVYDDLGIVGSVSSILFSLPLLGGFGFWGRRRAREGASEISRSSPGEGGGFVEDFGRGGER